LSTPPEGLRRGDAWRSGEAEVSVRWPPKPFLLPDANMVSLVLRVRWRDRELWLMGDATSIQERDLLSLGEPGAAPTHRLLKVGHHGSRGSSDPDWICALGPEVAVISAGRRNRFGHPHAETLETLRRIPVEVVGPRRGLRVEAVEGGWQVEGGDGLSRTHPWPAAPR
jgi:competence protein ComEC